MKIAVCVRAGADATVHKRIDPAAKRLDRSGEAALNPMDLNAVEEALRIKEARGGEVVLVSLGPAKAVDSLRKALAMGAGEPGSSPTKPLSGLISWGRLARSPARSKREEADLVLFGQSSGAGTSAGLWSAVADRLSRGGVAGCGAHGRGGCSHREAPDRARIRPHPRAACRRWSRCRTRSTSRAIRRSRGSWAPRRSRRRRCRSAMSAWTPAPRARRARGQRARPRPASVPWRPGQDRGRRLGGAEGPRPRHRRGSSCEVARVPQRAPRRRARRRAGSECSRRRRHSARRPRGLCWERVQPGLRLEPARTARRRPTRARRQSSPRRFRSRRVDALATLVEKLGADAVLFAASVLAADVASGLAAVLDAGLNWDLMDMSLTDGELVGKRPALGDTVLVDVSWKGSPKLALIRAGGVRSRRVGRICGSGGIRYDLLRLLHARDARRAHAGGVK